MSETTRSFWIAVASANHVARGLTGGFMQVCHGKEGPLKRLRQGDGVAYYSPIETFGARDTCQAFTAIGTVRDAAPYQAEMRPGMLGYRRDIDWLPARETPISDLTDRLEFTRGNWGMLARRGMFEVSGADFQTIRAAMLQE